MITFTQLNAEIQSSIGNTDTAELIIIKRDANRVVNRFKSVMRRPWSRIAKKTDTVANQQDYQLPRSVLRPSGVDYLYGSEYFPLIEVGSEQNWNRLNAVPSVTIGIPRFYFPKGKNIISIYPVPGTAVTEGIRVYYEPRQTDMEADDYSTGTVTVTQNSTTITHSAAGFTESMVGRYFHVTDGSHGYWYQIVAYVDTSNLTLENYYEGNSGSGKTFLIGVVPDIPDEYHDAIMDYCIARHHIRRGNISKATGLLKNYDDALNECKEMYSSPTSDDRVENLTGVSMNLFDIPPSILS